MFFSFEYGIKKLHVFGVTWLHDMEAIEKINEH